MGFVCCKLLHLFCCPPSVASIVSKLAFNPPTCTYCILKNDEGDEKITLINELFNLGSHYSKYIQYYSIQRGGKGVLACAHIKTAPWTKDTILLSHGNAVDIGMVLGTFVDLGLRLKINIVTYDYSGYGLSTGEPSERRIYKDATSVLDFVRHMLDIPLKNIVIYGQSIGSVPSTYLASRYKFGLLVLHSPFASGLRLIQCCCFISCCDVLDNANKANKIQTPTLIIHGTDDNVIPVEHSYHILSRIPQERVLDPLFISGANHNDCENFPEYMARLKDVIANDLPRFQHNFSDSLYK